MKIGCISLIEIQEQVVAIHCSKGRGYILPGGKHEEGETFTQTAARELYEEAGLKATLQELVFQAPDGFGDFVLAFATDVQDFHLDGRRTELVGMASWDQLCQSQYKAYYQLLRTAIKNRPKGVGYYYRKPHFLDDFSIELTPKGK